MLTHHLGNLRCYVEQQRLVYRRGEVEDVVPPEHKSNPYQLMQLFVFYPYCLCKIDFQS